MKARLIFFLITIVVLLPFIVEATSFTSTTLGNWNDGATWGNASPGVEGTDWPSSTDDVIINSGDNVTLTADRTINSIDVQGSGILSMIDKKLTVNGNFNCDGSITSTADLLMYGRSIGGSGTVTLTGKKFKIYTDVTVIEPGSTLTISDEIKIETDDINIINYGTLTVNGKIIKKNDGNIWINEANSVLNVSGQFMDNNLIEASAIPNTINFNGTDNQDVFAPVSSYHHVQFSDGADKNLKEDTDFNGDITIGTGVNFKSNNRNITLAGNWINNGTFTQGTGTVSFDGTSTISGSTNTTFYDIAIIGSLTGHATDMNVSGSWTDNGTFTHNNGNVTFNGSTTLSGSSASSFCGVTISGILNGHPTNMNVDCNWINNGTFNHNSGKVTFTGTSTLSGSSISSFYDITITGILTGVSLGNFNVAGDWDNSGGTFASNNGTVTFNGTTASTISNTGSGNFNDLTINNTTASNAITLNNSITVDGTITFTDGHLVSSSSSPLIIETSGVASGVTDASYVQGSVAKNTNSTANFVFPVGDNNSYRPIEVTPTSTDATTFKGRYYSANQSLGSGLGAGIDHISTSEYWEMERSTGTANADVILTWNASSQVDNLTELRVVQFDGSNWIDKGNDATTGTTTAGTITINAVSSFTTKNFTLASSTSNNPLSMDRYTVVSSGNWSDASTWAYSSGGTPGASVPTASQNAIIEGGATISLTAETFINDLEIKSGNTVNGGANRLNINGVLIVDGAYNSAEEIKYYGTSIDGSGTITLTGKDFKIFTDVTEIEPGSTLTIIANKFKFETEDIDIINYGTLTVTGNIEEKNNNLWINEVNSVLNVSGQFMADNLIEASAAPNTINFDGTGNQDVFTPVSSYHHVQFSGGGIKTQKQNTDINGDVTISTANFNSNNRDITLAGNWINDGTFTQGTGTVTFDGTSTISGSTTTTFYDLVITGSLTGHATDMNVSGSWTDNGTYSHNNGNVTFTVSTALAGSSATSFCGVTISGILNGHPTNMNVACNWINNGTFNHNSGKVTFTGTSALSGSSTSSFYDLTITGALTGVSSGNFNVAGDWDTNGGTFTSNSGTVTFNGATASTISNTGSGNFNNLTINNTTASDAVTLNNSITVDGMITLTDGHLITTSSSPLIIETSGVVSAVSDASYVQGPVAKKTNSTANFVFPVGDNNSYRPIQVTPTSTNATTFTGRYYRAGQTLGSGLGAGIHHVSYWEYWEMERSTGTANADVILTWDANSQVDNLTDLRVAQFDGSNWIDKGNNATTGTAAAGTITINAVSSFTTKNFTLASSTTNNPLSMDRYTVSIASGSWLNPNNWAYYSGGPSGASVPTASQNAIIEGGVTINQPANIEINNLEIKSGNTVNGIGIFTVYGDLIVDGTYSKSTGDIEYFGTSINGSGTITLTGKALKVKTDGTVIEPGANLTLSANELKIDVNDIDVTNYGTLTVTGDIKRQNDGNIWTNAANSVVNVGGVFMEDNQIEASATPNTINFNGSADQDVFMPVSSYHHVQFSGGGIKRLMGNTDINGDVTITTAEFKANNRDITLAGNWINNGTFNHGTGTVTFDGTSTISGSTITTFNNVVINTSGGILLSTEAKIAGTLTLTDGIISTDNTNILAIEEGGTSNDGSENSFIDGPMKKIGNTDFTFPVGDGSAWAPAMVSSIAGGSATTELTGEYFFAIPPNRTELPVSGITYLSEVEYWEVDNNTADVTSAEITLFWKDSDRSLISEITNGQTQDLIAAHYNAITPEWEALNSLITIGSTTGPGGTGSVKATTTSFSPFTFASAFGNNPLPIELTYFTGMAQEDVVMLKWETASELNNDFFTIEHSPDGVDFYELAQTPGSGTTSTVNTYSYVDEHPFYGLSYYRLKQTDFDGKFEYSDIILVQVLSAADPNEIDFVIYPNPASNGRFSVRTNILQPKNEKFQVVVRDNFGREVESKVFQKENRGKISLDLDLSLVIKPGIYFVTVNIQNTQIHKKLIVK